jgi:hypothetical protein
MFPTIATVKQVQKNFENNRFYAKAEVTLKEDVDQAELQLKDFDGSVHATVLMNETAGAGVHLFHIEGDGEPPFKVGDTIRVNCFSKAKCHKNDQTHRRTTQYNAGSKPANALQTDVNPMS